APEGVDAQGEVRAADGFHVHDTPQVFDVGDHAVPRVGGGGLDGRGDWHALDSRVASAQHLVGPVLDPFRDVGVGRAAVGRVVFEAAILGRVVRRRDHDAVREVF